jgi:hypothetical protein
VFNQPLLAGKPKPHASRNIVKKDVRTILILVFVFVIVIVFSLAVILSGRTTIPFVQTPSPSPTATPIYSSPTASPSSTPEAPEFPATVIALTVLLVVSTAILFFIRKHKMLARTNDKRA